jgi:hypothetical protein
MAHGTMRKLQGRSERGSPELPPDDGPSNVMTPLAAMSIAPPMLVELPLMGLVDRDRDHWTPQLRSRATSTLEASYG